MGERTAGEGLWSPRCHRRCVPTCRGQCFAARRDSHAGKLSISYFGGNQTEPRHARHVGPPRHALFPPPPPPPASVAAVKPPDTIPANATTRQRFEMHSTDPVCAACHRDIDPLGFAFEHYDAAGLWRDTENGLPIDATGEIFKTDAKGKFNGALELSERLSQSRDVQNCFVGKWMAYGYGRKETPDDVCTRQVLENAFTKSKGNVIELIVALTQTDAFLYRSDKE